MTAPTEGLYHEHDEGCLNGCPHLNNLNNLFAGFFSYQDEQDAGPTD